jgi:asparagine synthase (glutamine-hydrolysing)
MCGIAGWRRLDGAAPVTPEHRARLTAMTDSIAHRGPDGEGVFLDTGIALGHRRLAIIDLSTGDQPMTNARGDLVVVFNGEIYNYLELRQELEALGHNFRTTSDTEVILTAYDEWGVDCQSRFNGMWAIALWDIGRQRLLLSRDRLGEKPLYWGVHDGVLYFGSEMKALLTAGVPRERNLDVLELYATFGWLPAPYTFYRGIRLLAPGHQLVVEGSGPVRESAWWSLPLPGQGDMLTDRARVYREFERLFDDAVRIRMRSDVPFGAFLSGGLDSSSIVACMVDHSAQPVSTFTVGFDDRLFDERRLARAVADRFGTNHHEVLIDAGSLDESIRKVLHHTDEPFGDSSAIPTGRVAMAARRHVKMVLTGDGGDEVLSGYTSYQGEKFAAQWQRLPRFVKRGVPALAGAGAQLVRGSLRYRMNRIRNVLESADWPYRERLVAKLSWTPGAVLRELLPPDPNRIRVLDYMADVMGTCPWPDPFYRHMFFHLKYSLPDDMLKKVDRMSMAHALETRLPFLDHRLVEFMVGVHRDVKMEGYERKSVLRRTIGRRLPAAIRRAPKKGFAVPLRSWYRGPEGAPVLAATRAALAGVVDAATLEEVIRKNSSSTEDFGNFLWMMSSLGAWLRS